MAGSSFLRIPALLLRLLQFIFSLVCMAIFSYFVAVLRHAGLRVLPKWVATETLVVLATVYTLLALLLVICLAGSKIFGFIAIFFDLFFIGAFIAVAWFTRHGAYQCSGLVQTPVGDGLSQYGAFGIVNFAHLRPSLGSACILNRVVFALSIILIFLFLITAILQVLMSRSKKDKRYASNEKDYNNTRSSKTPIWKRNQRTRSRSSERRRHREKDLAVAGAGATAARGVHGRRSGDSGSTLSDNGRARTPKHHESGFDRPGHTPVVAPTHNRHGHHGQHGHTAPGNDVTYLARGDGTYLAQDDGTYGSRNDPNAPIHSVTVHSPTVTTTTSMHPAPAPVVTRDSSRGRRGQPGYTENIGHGHGHSHGHGHGHTHVPGTQGGLYHDATTDVERNAAERNLLNNNAALNQPGHNHNIVGGQREYHDTTRGQNILPSQTGGVNTIGNQRDYNPTATYGQPGYDGQIGTQRGYDNRDQMDYGRNNSLGRRDVTPGRDTTLGRERDITPGRHSNRNTIENQRGYDNNDYNRDSTFRNSRDVTPGRVRDITPGRDTVRGQHDYDRNVNPDYNRNTVGNQRDYDDGRGYNTNTNLNQGYNDNFNQNSSYNRTPSAGRVRRF